MSKQSRFDVLDKVRKILALAESEAKLGNEAVAERFNKRARKMLADFGIDEAMAYADLDEAAKVAAGPTSRDLVARTPYPTAKGLLLVGLARAMGVRTVRLNDPNANDSREIRYTLVGFPGDIDRFEILYTSLLVQAAFELAHQYVPAYEHKGEFQEAFMHGYREIVVSRIKAAEEVARTGQRGTGTSVVLASRQSEVDALLRKLFPDLGSGGFGKLIGGSGVMAGQVAGARADLGGARIGGGRAAARAIGG